jgi:hypothetical protein
MSEMLGHVLRAPRITHLSTIAANTGLYDLLVALWPSPVVALNRAVAIGFADGPAAGLDALDPVVAVATAELDGRPVVISGSDDETIRVSDLATGASIGQPLTGHTGYVYALATAQLDGLRRQEGGSTALRLMLARFSILVIRVARQVRASRPDAGPRAVSHPLITSGSVMDSAAADAAAAVTWAWAEERGTEQDVGETRRHFAPASKIRRPDYLPNVARRGTSTRVMCVRGPRVRVRRGSFRRRSVRVHPARRWPG